MVRGLITVILTCLVFYSCHRNDIPPCESSLDAFFYPVVFQLVSDSGKSLVGEFGTQYESDNVKLIKEDSTVANNFKVGGSGNISFLIPDFGDETDRGYERTLYLILPGTGSNPKEDVDTITTKYELLIDEKCKGTWYRHFEISYNDSLYNAGEFPLDRLKFLKN